MNKTYAYIESKLVQFEHTSNTPNGLIPLYKKPRVICPFSLHLMFKILPIAKLLRKTNLYIFLIVFPYLLSNISNDVCAISSPSYFKIT